MMVGSAAGVGKIGVGQMVSRGGWRDVGRVVLDDIS